MTAALGWPLIASSAPSQAPAAPRGAGLWLVAVGLRPDTALSLTVGVWGHHPWHPNHLVGIRLC